jgi:activator of HSP90 ATPase
MNETAMPSTKASPITRRRLIAGFALGLGGVAAYAAADDAARGMKEAPALPRHARRTFLHQEVEFKQSPQRIYEVLLDAAQFATFTGLPAQIDPAAGGAFSTFGGLIVGRNVELIPGQRIVQAWRAKHWKAGIYSVVKFELESRAGGTLVVLDHSGFPQGEYDHLYEGWKLRYWDPLRKFLG